MGSFNTRFFKNNRSTIVEGIAILPEFQGKGIFRSMIGQVRCGNEYLCLRTQNPRMYRALSNFCENIYPNGRDTPEHIITIREEFAKSLNCNIDGNGVVKGYYGGLFYGIEPHHNKVDSLFRELGINLNKGDALLVIGEIKFDWADVI